MKNIFNGFGSKLKSITKTSIKRKPAGKGAVVSKNSKLKISKKRTPAQVAKLVLFYLIVLLFCIEAIFAVTIYGFKSKDVVTKWMANIIPYPAVFTASGIVTVSDYWKEKDYIEHFYASTKQTDIDPSQLSLQILQQEAENKIIKKEAITFKINISKKDIEDSMAQIYDSNGGQAEVEKALQDLYGLNVNQFKSLVSTQLLRDQISSNVIKHVTVRHILIRVDEGATQEQIDAAKAKIDGYLAEIKNGLSFEEAAKKYSEDVGSNQNGGLLEPFARGDMVKEFEDVAFSSKVGEISEPFRTSFGWHILVVEKTEGYIDRSFENWISELLKQNYVFYIYKD